MNTLGVVASPVKSFGLLTAIVVERHLSQSKRARDKTVERLEQRLAGLRKIAKAKAILMNTRGISEDEAYKIIRDQAMSKRVTTEEIAEAVVNANEILGLGARPKNPPAELSVRRPVVVTRKSVV
jgi:AmiR/NasT family two-component response regulator